MTIIQYRLIKVNSFVNKYRIMLKKVTFYSYEALKAPRRNVPYLFCRILNRDIVYRFPDDSNELYTVTQATFPRQTVKT